MELLQRIHEKVTRADNILICCQWRWIWMIRGRCLRGKLIAAATPILSLLNRHLPLLQHSILFYIFGEKETEAEMGSFKTRVSSLPTSSSSLAEKWNNKHRYDMRNKIQANEVCRKAHSLSSKRNCGMCILSKQNSKKRRQISKKVWRHIEPSVRIAGEHRKDKRVKPNICKYMVVNRN